MPTTRSTGTNSSPGTHSVSSDWHIFCELSAERERLSPITKMWPPGMGPTDHFSSQAPLVGIGPLQVAPPRLT